MIDRALVLAAGKSTRIAGISGGEPKPLLMVSDRPIIAWTLEWLAEFGVREAWVNLHYRPDDIRSRLGDGSEFGLRIRYSHEPEILGTAGAFRRLRHEWSGPTLVIYGDNLMRFDLARFQSTHTQHGVAATVALFDPARHPNTKIAGGKVVVDGAGLVTSFAEGQTTVSNGVSYVNAGAYVLEPSVADNIPDGYQDFGADVLPKLAGRRQLSGHLMEDGAYCLGLDTPDSYAVAQTLISARQVTLG
jgi:NDP-sugar pyrophosphorylase family protein